MTPVIAVCVRHAPGRASVGWLDSQHVRQESLANAKVSARQQCVYEGPYQNKMVFCSDYSEANDRMVHERHRQTQTDVNNTVRVKW